MKKILFILNLIHSIQAYSMNADADSPQDFKLMAQVDVFRDSREDIIYQSAQFAQQGKLYLYKRKKRKTITKTTKIYRNYYIQTPRGGAIPLNFDEANPLDINSEYLVIHPEIINCESLWKSMVHHFHGKIYFRKGPAHGQRWSDYYHTIKVYNEIVWERFFWMDYPNLINTFQKPEGLAWKQVYLELKDALHWMEKVRESFGPRYIDCGPPQGRTWREYYHDIESSQQGLSLPNRIEL